MLFSKKNEKGEYVLSVLFGEKDKTNFVYTIAEAHAIDLIAKTISKCKLQIFSKNPKSKKIEETRDEIHWALNIQPNHYENGTSFMYRLVTQLLTRKKALVLINKDIRGDPLLYVADDYIANNSILYGKIFTDVSISDNEGNSIKMVKPYDSTNSIYYNIYDDNLRTASNNFKTNAAKILNTAIKSYKTSNTPKWRIKNSGLQPTLKDIETGEEIDYKTYINKISDGLLSDDEAVFMLAEIFDLINVNKDINSKDISDLEKQITQITDTVARNWNIPLDIFYGSKTEKSTGTNDFITFAVAPYFNIIEDGLNIGLVGKQDYLEGEYIQFNKYNITHKDIIDSASGIDKLFADGFSRNEINKLLGLPKINEEWADKHYVTKNYANVEGGVNDGK